MEIFEAKPKQWGNSLGITIPNDIVKKEHLSTNKTINVFIFEPQKEKLEKIFGTLKFKRSTQKLMDEIDKGYD